MLFKLNTIYDLRILSSFVHLRADRILFVYCLLTFFKENIIFAISHWNRFFYLSTSSFLYLLRQVALIFLLKYVGIFIEVLQIETGVLYDNSVALCVGYLFMSFSWSIFTLWNMNRAYNEWNTFRAYKRIWVQKKMSLMLGILMFLNSQGNCNMKTLWIQIIIIIETNIRERLFIFAQICTLYRIGSVVFNTFLKYFYEWEISNDSYVYVEIRFSWNTEHFFR